LLAYCLVDENVLRISLCYFRNLFFKLVKLDPFRQTISISFICNRLFRTCILKVDTVGIIHQLCFRLGDKVLKWLAYVGRVKNIVLAGNVTEVHLARVPDLEVGMYCEEINIVFEYLAWFRHIHLNRQTPLGKTHDLMQPGMGRLAGVKKIAVRLGVGNRI